MPGLGCFYCSCIVDVEGIWNKKIVKINIQEVTLDSRNRELQEFFKSLKFWEQPEHQLSLMKRTVTVLLLVNRKWKKCFKYVFTFSNLNILPMLLFFQFSMTYKSVVLCVDDLKTNNLISIETLLNSLE